MIPHREVYWNIEGHLLIYLFLVIALIFFFYGYYRLYKYWRIGQPRDLSGHAWERIKSVLVNAFGHARVLRETYPGIMHFAIFWGFLVMVVGTIIVMLEADLGFKLIYGNFYLYFMSLGLDMAGLAAIIGIVMAIIRRYVLRPGRLDNKPDDAWSLILILVILITGFVLEGLRIAATRQPWDVWSPVGWLIAGWLGPAAPWQETLHRVLWWAHMALALGFIAYIPFSKLSHIFLSPLNQYYRSLEPKGALIKLDLENEEAESFGVAAVEQFTWKDLFDAEACTRCGRCRDNCPAHLSQKALCPKKLIQDIKGELEIKAPVLLSATAVGVEGQAAEAAASSEAVQSIASRVLIGEAVSEEEIWTCTTCRSCMEQCPVFVEQVPKLVEMRRYLVLTESRFPAEAQTAFRNMENNGNPWGVGWANRADWATELGVKVAAEDSDMEILYWPGCAGAFDDRNRRVATAMVKLLQAAGVNFGILGTEEKCCGDSARRLGNEYLFQMLVEENVETMKGYNVKKIVTQCPHCYNTLKNEYPQFGGDFEVVHHTQYLLELVSSGRLKVQKPLGKRITYHDSCYLGRYNDIYREPRQLLQAAGGTQVLEMERHHNRSFCCGAGGGRMWLEEREGQRINIMRTEQALATNPEVVCTACPFCLTMLGDGLKDKGLEEQVAAMDIAEILAGAV